MNIKEELKQLTFSIGSYLLEHLKLNNGFNNRSFYGETFTLALLERTQQLTPELKKLLIELYQKKDKTDPQFHFEFNNYALYDLHQKKALSNEESALFPLRFKNTPCTNWSLLRANVKLSSTQFTSEVLSDVKTILQKRQKLSGLITDDKGVNSFQYHSFSAVMLMEIFESTKDQSILESALNATTFIRNFILPDGDTLYIGRGQEQSFGYGTLVYLLSLAYKHTKDHSIVIDLKKIVQFIKKNQNRDGSLPLVLGSNSENKIPKTDELLNNPEFCGLYAYNNFFDYLPFTGFFLHKALLLLSDFNFEILERPTLEKNYRDKDFLKIVSSNYIAVLAKPGGYWTNDLPMPLIYNNYEVITPCYGGEQFVPSMYKKSAIPLPYFSNFKYTMRDFSFSFLWKEKLFVISPFGFLIRSFYFHPKQIVVRNFFFSPFKYQDTYLFFKNKKVASFSSPISHETIEYSAKGELVAFHFNKIVKEITIEVSP